MLDNLPHFLLVLLIIQRFDLARWGFFTEFKESKIHPKRGPSQVSILEATFGEGDTVHIFPVDDPVYGGINLAGRSTGAAGARRIVDGDADVSTPPQIMDDVSTPPQILDDSSDEATDISTSSEIRDDNSDEDTDILTSARIREGNKLIVKFSWPKETRKSEVEFIEKATKIGETNELVKDHIPTIVGHMDPPFLTCSTSLIRQFLGLTTVGARVLRVIAFHRLKEIKHLGEEDMLIAFLDNFFCKILSRFVHRPAALIP
jgi:hypothetical protein